MTIPKMKPCPRCGNADLSIYTYDSGWRHVECDDCLYLGRGEGSKLEAVKQHNAAHGALKALYATAPEETR